MIAQTVANLIAFIVSRLNFYKIEKSFVLQDIFLLQMMQWSRQWT